MTKFMQSFLNETIIYVVTFDTHSQILVGINLEKQDCKPELFPWEEYDEGYKPLYSDLFLPFKKIKPERLSGSVIEYYKNIAKEIETFKPVTHW
jgi:hypothetical protein